jgi:hypothetical protein
LVTFLFTVTIQIWETKWRNGMQNIFTGKWYINSLAKRFNL